MAVFEHHVELCTEPRIGAAGLPDLVRLPEMQAAGQAFIKLQQDYEHDRLALLRIPYMQDDLPLIIDAAQKIKQGARDIVFLGTGGSSLGGQALVQLSGWHVPGFDGFGSGPRLHFFDNLDGASFAALLRNLPFETARFVVTSKSGGTAETLVQAMIVIEHLQKAGLNISERMFGITEPENWKSNALRALLASHGVMMLDHCTRTGGRYSALTNVGLLPAAIAGLDIQKIREGAREIVDPIANPDGTQDHSYVVGAGIMTTFAARDLHESVLFAYADKLERFTAWYAQLWAESLGKNGEGTTPVRALGPVDQHSQLQLFLDGPRNKVFTIMTTDCKGEGPQVNADMARRAGLDGFANKTIGDLVTAQGRATIETLAKRGRPVRHIHIPQLDERAIGALMMHFFLETIISADIMGVDAFDQPAVEEGKVLAKAYLAQ
ncbi:MAG: glucose-6-phosphate isomerase [Pseudomonadota bacterium]